MKTLMLFSVLFLIAINFSGCIATKDSANSFTLTTETQHDLYNLMVNRCKALSSADMEQIKMLYSENSTEPEWIADVVLPVLREWPAEYKISSVEKITVVGRDAAATYRVLYYNQYKSDRKLVDVLYEMGDGGWKLYSVNSR